MDEFEKEVKLDFLAEATQLLNDAERAFLALEGDKNNANLMNEIFRLAHNLKGTSRAVGFGDVAEFTHEMENLILRVKEGKVPITDGIVSLLLECNDHVSTMIKGLSMDLFAKFSSGDIIVKIKKALHEKTETVVEAAPAKKEISRKDPAKDAAKEAIKDVMKELVKAESMEEGKTSIGESISAEDLAILEQFERDLDAPREVLTDAQKENRARAFFPTETLKANVEVVPTKIASKDEPVAVAEVEAAPKKASNNNNNKGTEDDSIRVSLARVETLNNVVGELVIIQTVLNQHREEVRNPLILKSLTQLGKLSKEIQNISMSLRMVPLKQTLQKMQRIVRDTSKALDKKVNLELIGEETEIDKIVLEHLADPLVHIVRNAVDHGLESRSDRLMVGKSEEGRVSIRAYHEGNNLVIEIKDDGKGIDPKIIRDKAIEKKVIAANANLSDDELINLIFHPGFSTKAEVTEISGRGVGMDVVKTNIAKLSGEVRVTTEIGKGSVFRVVLPLTLAIIEAMVTQVGDERYIIPLGQVYESLSPTNDIVHHVNGIGDCLTLRGQIIPMFKISTALKRPMKDKPICEQIAIIVNSEEKNFAVLVDDILHQQQVVIKKLGDEIKNQQGFMGSSILGDGRPAFILDLIELFSGTMKKKKPNILEESAA